MPTRVSNAAIRIHVANSETCGMPKIKVLFLCVHNSARSQMAEAYLKQIAGDKFHVESAGLEPGKLNPLAIEVMNEDGIDISGNTANDVFDFFKHGKSFQYVITVCDAKASEQCPVFPGLHRKINWSFDDPSAFTGTRAEKLIKTRAVRDQIKQAVQKFVAEVAVQNDST
jgi:arsenate reductase